MTELDETALLLGQLKADMESSRTQRRQLFHMVGEIQKATAVLPQLVETIEKQQHDMAHLQAWKNKALGVLATVPLIGGYAWHFFGYEIIFYAGAVIAFVSLIFAQFMPLEKRRSGN